VIPIGEYDGTVLTHHFREYGRDETVVLEVQFGIGEVDVAMGRFFFTEKAAWRGRKWLRSVGFDLSVRDAQEIDGPAPDGKYLLAGTKCRVKISHYSKNGTVEAQAEPVLPKDIPVEKAKLSKLAAIGKGAPSAKPAAAAPAATDLPSDEPGWSLPPGGAPEDAPF